jgi:UDP-N-acetylglucosamine acyltransferase
VTIGRRCVIGASAVIDGWTEIGDRTRVFPMASIGLAPQDLKYKGERTRLVIGADNTFREFVTINRGTVGGGGETRIGDGNLFMAYVHVAHDCHVGSHTIFANGATLAGHVEVMDYAQIGAFSGVHQFCRVGAHAFMGGATVATKDVLPFSLTVGNRARFFGLNLVGLRRRGFSPEQIAALKQACRLLSGPGLALAEALRRIEAEAPMTDEVRTLVEFVRSSKRGVVLERRRGVSDDDAED